MRKRVSKKINISNRWLYAFITLGILAILGIGVYAYGTSSPSTFGHSAGEIDLSGVGNIISTGYIHASITGGNSNLASSTYEIAGTNIAGQTVYAYGKMCVGNSAGNCEGTGGTIISSSDIITSNLGIGTTTPTQKLDVNGNAKIAKTILYYADTGSPSQLSCTVICDANRPVGTVSGATISSCLAAWMYSGNWAVQTCSANLGKYRRACFCAAMSN